MSNNLNLTANIHKRVLIKQKHPTLLGVGCLKYLINLITQ